MEQCRFPRLIGQARTAAVEQRRDALRISHRVKLGGHRGIGEAKIRMAQHEIPARPHRPRKVGYRALEPVEIEEAVLRYRIITQLTVPEKCKLILENLLREQFIWWGQC